MKHQIAFVFIFAALCCGISATKYTKCSLAKALLKNGFPKKELPNWVCLVFSESDGDTSAEGHLNTDGSVDYGLFQINSRYWCKVGSAGGDCHIDCRNLVNDNISDDSKCAQLIYSQYGFGAWVGWKNKCQGKLPDLTDCGI